MHKLDRSEGHPLREQGNRALQLLGTLAPGPLDQPSTSRALAEFKANTTRRDDITMFQALKTNRKTQRILGGVAAAALLIGLVAWTPVGTLASELLSLFRVEKFVVVGVDPQRVQQLVKALDQETLFGDQEILEQVGEPRQVTSLNEATQVAGFQPLRAAESFGEPATIMVNSHTVTRFTPNAEALRRILIEFELDPELIPEDIDGKPFDITVPVGIVQSYLDKDTLSKFDLAEMPSPTVSVPDGVDIKALGKTMLQLLGMSSQQAERMSSTIDWTTTLVLPVPTDMMSNMQETNVRGANGLLFWNDPDERHHAAVLMWQENGHLFVVTGPGTGDVLAFVEGLR